MATRTGGNGIFEWLTGRRGVLPPGILPGRLQWAVPFCAPHCRLPGAMRNWTTVDKASVDKWDEKWDIRAMKAATIDDKRRIVLPKKCPPGGKITIEEVDALTWIVRLHPSGVRFKRVLIPVVEKLHSDKQKKRMEDALGRAAYAKLPPPPED